MSLMGLGRVETSGVVARVEYHSVIPHHDGWILPCAAARTSWRRTVFSTFFSC